MTRSSTASWPYAHWIVDCHQRAGFGQTSANTWSNFQLSTRDFIHRHHYNSNHRTLMRPRRCSAALRLLVAVKAERSSQQTYGPFPSSPDLRRSQDPIRAGLFVQTLYVLCCSIKSFYKLLLWRKRLLYCNCTVPWIQNLFVFVLNRPGSQG